MRSLDRRQFFSVAALGAVAASGIERFVPLGRHARQAQDDLFVINMLGGISNPNTRVAGDTSTNAVPGTSGRRRLNARAIEDALASGLAATNVTVGFVSGPHEPFEYSVAEVANWNGIVRRHPEALLKVWTATDIERAHAEGKIGVILGFQNASMMGDDAGRVEVFAGLGVKIIQLTYNVANQLGHGSMVPENGGLTPFGHEVVAALNDSRTLVDLSHSGERTCLDALRVSSAPIAITHTGCRTLANLPRNKTDEELRLVADGGGFVGIYFMPYLKEDSFPDATDVVRHIEHAIDVCGEDHVGIGTDGGTTAVDDLEAYRAVIQREIEQRAAEGIGATGERPGVVPFVPDLSGPKQFQQLADLLASRGHGTGRIEKVLGLNALRVMREVWGG